MTPKKKKGSPKKHRTEKEKLRASRKICNEYANGKSTIESICASYGIPCRTFNDWADPSNDRYIADIAELYKKAKDGKHRRYMDRLSQLAKTALEKRVEGYEIEEKHHEASAVLDEEGKILRLVPKKVKTIKKQISPDTTAIIFALKNTDPDYFKDTHEYNVGDRTMEGLFEFLRTKGRAALKEEAKKPKAEIKPRSKAKKKPRKKKQNASSKDSKGN